MRAKSQHKHFDEIVESVTDADPTAPDTFSDKLTGFVERISTHADDCVATMQVDGNEMLGDTVSFHKTTKN